MFDSYVISAEIQTGNLGIFVIQSINKGSTSGYLVVIVVENVA